jgi:hypothetical protein
MAVTRRARRSNCSGRTSLRDALCLSLPLALVADLFMLRPTAMWLINLSQRLRGTAGRAKPAE